MFDLTLYNHLSYDLQFVTSRFAFLVAFSTILISFAASAERDASFLLLLQQLQIASPASPAVAASTAA